MQGIIAEAGGAATPDLNEGLLQKETFCHDSLFLTNCTHISVTRHCRTQGWRTFLHHRSDLHTGLSLKEQRALHCTAFATEKAHRQTMEHTRRRLGRIADEARQKREAAAGKRGKCPATSADQIARPLAAFGSTLSQSEYASVWHSFLYGPIDDVVALVRERRGALNGCTCNGLGLLGWTLRLRTRPPAHLCELIEVLRGCGYDLNARALTDAQLLGRPACGMDGAGTALHLAAALRYPFEVLETLLECGASAVLRDGFDMTPIDVLASLGDAALLRRVLEVLSDSDLAVVLTDPSPTGMTVLHHAAVTGPGQALRRVLDDFYAVIDVQAPWAAPATELHMTPGHFAARYSGRVPAKLPTAAAAQKDSRGYTAADLARMHRDLREGVPVKAMSVSPWGAWQWVEQKPMTVLVTPWFRAAARDKGAEAVQVAVTDSVHDIVRRACAVAGITVEQGTATFGLMDPEGGLVVPRVDVVAFPLSVVSDDQEPSDDVTKVEVCEGDELGTRVDELLEKRYGEMTMLSSCVPNKYSDFIHEYAV